MTVGPAVRIRSHRAASWATPGWGCSSGHAASSGSSTRSAPRGAAEFSQRRTSGLGDRPQDFRTPLRLQLGFGRAPVGETDDHRQGVSHDVLQLARNSRAFVRRGQQLALLALDLQGRRPLGQRGMLGPAHPAGQAEGLGVLRLPPTAPRCRPNHRRSSCGTKRCRPGVAKLCLDRGHHVRTSGLCGRCPSDGGRHRVRQRSRYSRSFR